MKKKLLACLLALAMVITMIPMVAFADEPEYPWEGSGTAEDPYLIETLEDLDALAKISNGGESFEGVYFLQTADIGTEAAPFMQVIAANIDSDPIDMPKTMFSGHYNGGGNTVTVDLKPAGKAAPMGLFGVLWGAEVRDVIVTGKIEVDNPESPTGGICGRMHDGTLLDNCVSDCDITFGCQNPAHAVGGICGLMGTKVIQTSGTIMNCSFTGKITAVIPGITAGGICGKAFNDNFAGIIMNCYVGGEIATTAGGDEFFGICGKQECNTQLTIVNNFVNCQIETEKCKAFGTFEKDEPKNNNYFNVELAPKAEGDGTSMAIKSDVCQSAEEDGLCARLNAYLEEHSDEMEGCRTWAITEGGYPKYAITFAGGECCHQEALTEPEEDADITIAINGKQTDDIYTFKKGSQNGTWLIENEDGKYFALDDDGTLTLTEVKANAAVWTWTNGMFAAAVDKQVTTPGFWFLFWYIGGGTRTVTTTYTLSTLKAGSRLNALRVSTELFDNIADGDHALSYYDLGNGWHRVSCARCGEEAFEKCTYNLTGAVEENEYRSHFACVCGATVPEDEQQCEIEYDSEKNCYVQVPNATFTIGDFVYTVTDDFKHEVTVGTTNKKIEGTLIIPTRVEIPYKGTYKVVGVSDEGFKGCTLIDELIIPSGYKYLGSAAFVGCTGLKMVVLGRPAQGGLTFGDSSSGTAVFTGVGTTADPCELYFMNSEHPMEWRDHSEDPAWFNEVLKDFGEPEISTLEMAAKWSSRNGMNTDECFCISKGDKLNGMTAFPAQDENKVGMFYLIARPAAADAEPDAAREYFLIEENAMGTRDSGFEAIDTLNMPLNELASNSLVGDISEFNITTAIIGEGITGICGEFFSGLTGLKSVTLPSTLTYLNETAFAGCPALETVTFKSETVPTTEQLFAVGKTKEEPVTSELFTDCYVNYSLWEISVPGKSVDAYRELFPDCAAIIVPCSEDVALSAPKADLPLIASFNGFELCGALKLTAKDGKWLIEHTADNADAYASVPMYAVVENGKLNWTVVSKEASLWKWDNGTFSTDGYYLTMQLGKLTVSTVRTTVKLFERKFYEHHDYDNNLYKDYEPEPMTCHLHGCSVCGRYMIENCEYDEDSHLCDCGNYDPAYSTVKLEASTKLTTVRGWFWTSYNVFVTTIKAVDGTGLPPKSIEYSLDGRRWVRGTSFTTNAIPSNIGIRVTDSNNVQHFYTYSCDADCNGTIEGNPTEEITVSLAGEYTKYSTVEETASFFQTSGHIWPGDAASSPMEFKVPAGARWVFDNTNQEIVFILKPDAPDDLVNALATAPDWELQSAWLEWGICAITDGYQNGWAGGSFEFSDSTGKRQVSPKETGVFTENVTITAIPAV